MKRNPESIEKIMKNEEINLAWQFVKNTGAHIFLTGKAGTGKTTFLRTLKQQVPKRMVVLAPTGIAAINAGGVTIHSFFQLPFSPHIPNTTFKSKTTNFRFGKEKQRIIRTMDLLVIDEISMVRADLLDAVDTVLRRYRDRYKPFGGVQMLMIGDLQQLPPVAKDDEWRLLQQHYESPYFFSSNALQQTEYITIELKHVFRQSDALFLDLLNQIRTNRADNRTFELLNRRYIPNFNPPEDAGYIRLTTHNYQAQQINDRKLSELSSPAFSFHAEVTGNFPEQSYPTDETLTVKKQAQVMFVKNDSSGQGRYYNGMLGKIIDVSQQEITVQSNDENTTIKLSREEWTNTRYVLNKKTQEITEEVEGTFRQYPLRLAWAVTIHKSQGLTFEHAIIDAQHSFAHGQTYVALSRCKTLDGLVLSTPLDPSAVICDTKVNDFNTYAAAHQPDDEMLSRMEKTYKLALLDELFDFRPVGLAFEKLFRLLVEHLSKKLPLLLTEYKQARERLDELSKVAVKFKLQYTQMLSTEDSSIDKRIHSAASYFHNALSSLHELHSKSSIETDNKALKNQLLERQTELHEALVFKLGILEYESRPEVSFSVSDYLSQKAKIQLEAMTPQTSSPRKSKTPKTNTRQITYTMFQQGLSVTDIASQRGLAESTILTHLQFYVSSGELSSAQLVDADKRDEILTILKRQPSEKQTLSEIRAVVSATITYAEISLVMADFYRGRIPLDSKN